MQEGWVDITMLSSRVGIQVAVRYVAELNQGGKSSVMTAALVGLLQ